MNFKNLMPLKKLDNTVDEFTIKVRILNMWYLKDNSDRKKIFSLEMAIMDEEGTIMVASIQNSFLPKFEAKLMIDGIYYIINPSIGSYKSKYFMIRDRDSKITFYYKTLIKKAESFSGSDHGFSFVDYDVVLSTPKSTIISNDVIGEIVFIDKINLPTSEKQQKRLDIHIRDLGGLQLKATLWGSLVDQLSEFKSNNNENVRVIVILQFVLINVWNGRSSVSTYYDATRMFINSDLPEITEFRKALNEQSGIESSSSALMNITVRSYSARDDFLDKFAFKNVIDVMQPPEVNKYVLMGTVTGILQNKDWFYMACNKCSRGVTKVYDMTDENNEKDDTVSEYRCQGDNCKNTTIKAVPRYKIPIRFQDSTGTITLSLFDRDAYRFLKKPATHFVNNIKMHGLDLKLFPQEFNIIKNQKMCLIIDVKPYNVRYNNNEYGVFKVSIDQDIMNELEQKLNLTEIADSAENDNGSVDIKSVKDCFSETGENATPCTVEKSCSTVPTKLIKNSDNMKRNLADVYDVDDPTNCLTTECNNPSSSTNKEVCLKIPKIEK